MLVLGCLVTVSTLACQSHAAPKPANTVDRLALSLEEVKQISGFDKFTREIDTGQPTADNYTPAGPCRAWSDEQVAFGDTWTQFRSIADSGDLDAGLQPPRPSHAIQDHAAPLTAPLTATAVQTVAVYPSGAAARDVFNRRVADMEECVDLNLPHLGGKATRPNSTTAVWVNEGFTSVFALKSTVLVDVSVMELSEAERIASDISQEIIGRIN